MTTPVCTQCHTRPSTASSDLCLTCRMPARMVATQNPLQEEVDRLIKENETLRRSIETVVKVFKGDPQGPPTFEYWSEIFTKALVGAPLPANLRHLQED